MGARAVGEGRAVGDRANTAYVTPKLPCPPHFLWGVGGSICRSFDSPTLQGRHGQDQSGREQQPQCVGCAP